MIYGKETFTLEQLVEFLSRKYRKNEKPDLTPMHMMKGFASQGMCGTFGKLGHIEANCWVKYPERRPTQTPRPATERNKERKCWNCGKTGHISRNCEASKPNEQIRTVASAIHTSDDVDHIKFNPTYIDSACSCHVVDSIFLLREAIPLTTPRTLIPIGGTAIRITHKGKSVIHTTNGTITLKEVYYAKGLEYNLIGVPTLEPRIIDPNMRTAT